MTTFSMPGALLMANVWWYAFTVLRPAQLLKPLGLYRSMQDIGTMPKAGRKRGAGPYYCRKSPEPVFLDQRPEDYELVEDFDGLSMVYGRMVEPFSQPIFEEVSNVVRQLTTPRSRLLDCSCGPGTEMLKLAELVPDGEVVGADLAAQMVGTAAANARKKGLDNVAFFQADVAAMPKHFGGRFDLIYCSLAFHHYPEPLAALREMRRALRSGGHALIIDAGPAWMKALASPLARWGDPGWVAFRTGDEFQALFEQAKFSHFHWTEILPGMGLAIGTK